MKKKLCSLALIFHFYNQKIDTFSAKKSYAKYQNIFIVVIKLVFENFDNNYCILKTKAVKAFYIFQKQVNVEIKESSIVIKRMFASAPLPPLSIITLAFC